VRGDERLTRKRSVAAAIAGSEKARRAARSFAPAVFLMLLPAIAYLPATRAGFIWDDDAHVTNSAPLRAAGGLRQIWFKIGATPQYYPLVHTSFWLEYQLWGLEPRGYHVTNIVLHALSAVVLWRILARLNVPGAWFAAAIFAIHPVHVESVAWISERKNVLSGIFYLSAAYAYLAWALSAQGPRRRSLYALSFFLYLAALLSKTVTCTLPIMLLLILWWKRGRIGRRDLLSVLPFLVAGLIGGLATVWMEKHIVGATGTNWTLTPVERGLIAGRVAWFYAWKLIWPQPLMFIYPRWQVEAAQLWQYVFPVGIMALLAALWLLRVRLGRGPITAVALFLIALWPASSFFAVYPMVFSFVMDHFQYLASISLIVLFVSLASTWAIKNRAARAMRIAVGLALIVVLSLLTHERCQAFRDAKSLWLDTLAKNPAAWMAHNNLAMELLNQGDLQGAKRHFESALELRPQSARTHNNLGGLLVVRRQYPAAVKHFEEALRIEPNFVGAHLNLCKALVTTGDIRQAMTHYLQALRVDGHVADTHDQLAFLLLHAADRQGANDFFDEALRIHGDWVLLANEMAWNLATSHDPDRRDPQRAKILAQKAAEQTHYANANILDTLAAAYAQSGNFQSAARTARRALSLAERGSDASLTQDIRHRIQLYESGRPYVATE
jgi:protein O-mannosyl-transferase